MLLKQSARICLARVFCVPALAAASAGSSQRPIVATVDVRQASREVLEAANRFNQKPGVTVKRIALHSIPGTLSIAPISLDFYRLPIEPLPRN
jgi:hypothetical protein